MTTKLPQFNKADRIRNPYGLARWLADKWGPRTKNGYKKYLPALLDQQTQQPGGKDNPVATKSIDMKKSTKSGQAKNIEKKIDPSIAALAGWWFGGDIARGIGTPTAAQQREFERQIQQTMRKKGRRLRKESAINKMQMFFNTKDNADTYVRKIPLKNGVQAESFLEKVLAVPPFASARFDPASHRWVKPENMGQTYRARGGKKRFRGSGAGAHERSVSGHGKGRIRYEAAGRKHKGETDLAAQRRKEGFTHGKVKFKR